MLKNEAILTIDAQAGDDIYDVLKLAVKKATDGRRIGFEFNGTTFTVEPGESFISAKERWTALTGIPVLTAEQGAAAAKKMIQEMADRNAKAIRAAGVANEKEMRESSAPTPETTEELATYVKNLVERPHDYGTCVYAMSLAAVAALNFVAHQLGVTGFQASCADMDVLRRTRSLDRGFKIVDFSHLLYPQYLNETDFPSWRHLLNEKDLRRSLRREASKLLREATHAHPDVIAHWRLVASDAEF